MEFNNLNNFGKQGSSGTTKKNDTVNSVAVDTVKKSRLDLSYSHKTTFNAGELVPIYQMEVLPGDVVDIDVSSLIRMSMPYAPVMDAPRYDINFFFVPYKQVWDKFSYLIGTSYEGGAPVIVDKVPLIHFDSTWSFNNGDFATRMEIPANVDMSKTGISISALPFKAYCKVWNEWYRDENLQSSADWSNNNNPDADLFVSKYNNVSALMSAQVGKGFLPTQRLRDYFSSCLPFIQKGDAPVISSILPSDIQSMYNDTIASMSVFNGNGANTRLPFYLTDADGNSLINGDSTSPLVVNGANGAPNFVYVNDTAAGGNLGSQSYLNLWASKSSDADFQYKGTGIGTFNITDLRNALVQQHQKELDARAGTRYYEKLLSYWGIELNPLEIGRTELIGGFHDLININNVVQSAPATSTTASSPLGSLGALSITTNEFKNQIKYSVSQYGLILGFITIRSNVTYSQGLPRLFTNISNWDFYNPTFEGISEQPVFKRELFLSENPSDNNAIFGYNQPFAYMKYRYNVASGLLGVNTDLSYYQLYSYQNKLNAAPTLSNDWIKYPQSVISNTLLLNDKNKEFINDFLADFYFNVNVLREMPVYSVPGVDKV